MNWARLLRILRELLERFIEILRDLFGDGEGEGDDKKPLGDDEVPNDELDLPDDRGVLSPPIVYDPHYQCSNVVLVLGFVPQADLEVEVNGVVVAGITAGFPMPHGQAVPVPTALRAGDVVRARQTVGGTTSDWSSPVTVRDHTVDYPAGPPRPQVNPAPVHECGSRTGVSNLLVGCNVWITADGTEAGRVNGAPNPHTGINVSPDYGLGQQVVAWADLCGDASPPSVTHITEPPPSPLPTPGFESLSAGSSQVTVNQLANGARFTVTRGAATIGPARTWGQRHLVNVAPPLTDGEPLAAQQTMCPGDPPSSTGSTTVPACSSLAAPQVGPVQAGDTHITLTSFVPDARIKVWIGSTKVGDSGGPVVVLTQPVADGDTLYVRQEVGTCIGSTVRVVNARCVAPPVGSDPAGLDLFPVGHTEYDGGTTVIDGITFSVKGTVYYPADADGADTPFRGRLAALGRVPIVFMAHGNHATHRRTDNPSTESCGGGSGYEEIPNHAGYDYLQRRLAQMGIVAASVYSNETNCTGYSATNMRHRAELMIASIGHFQSLDGGGDPIFGGRLDFSRTGLLGHSRGGEAVVVVPEVISLAGVTIAAVLSLAPTEAGASSGRPQVPFLTILPAADGDVSDNDGAKFYDAGSPKPLKAQVYVDRANHNFFNRQWPGDDGTGPSPRLSRGEHEAVLLAYGCAFYRAMLLGHPTAGYLTGRVLPPGVPTQHVHLSYEWDGQLTVDHHEDGNGIAVNSLGQATATSGGLSADEHAFSQSGASFNGTFYGNSTGMVIVHEGSGEFTSDLAAPQDLTDSEVWLRVAEVYEGSLPTDAARFALGVEDGSGAVAWVESDGVGGVPRPFERTYATKTMLSTLRFPAACFGSAEPKLALGDIQRIHIRPQARDIRPLAFDDLQVVRPR